MSVDQVDINLCDRSFFRSATRSSGCPSIKLISTSATQDHVCVSHEYHVSVDQVDINLCDFLSSTRSVCFGHVTVVHVDILLCDVMLAVGLLRSRCVRRSS